MKLKSPLFIATAAALVIFACGRPLLQKKDQSSLVNFVDPFIGTDYHGHTFPGATVPFGMVQLSPDTRLIGWDACAGYHYSDSSIIGFSHTHLSGTGIGDYGDILFMPFTGTVPLDSGAVGDIDSGYRSRFNRETENARPGYYNVELTDYNINVELSATARTGVHRYTFPEAEKAGILIDLVPTIHGHQNPLHEIKVLNNQEIQGLKVTSGWAKNHYVYFTAKFSKPFVAELFLNNELQEELAEVSGKNAKVKLNFQTEDGEEVIVKVGISAVGYEGSAKNLNQEVSGWDFDGISEKAGAAWEQQLSKIQVETDDISEKRTFYTAMYHSMIFPGIYSDVDGTYRGMDQQIHHSDKPNFTVFSLWDTHRALHPLFTIIQPEYNQELIRALLVKYDEGGILPMWGLASNYTGTMIGSHAVSVIVDAYMKGQRDFDTEKALEAMVHSVAYDTVKEISYPSEQAWGNLMPKAKLYEEIYGFVPCDLEKASVSKALEFAYNYWAIAIMAQDMGEDDIAEEFFKKSERYQTYFDAEVGFMRGVRLDGTWDEPFHPRYSAHWNSPYVEGNAWQWTWYVPHDVDGLINLMGGQEAFAVKLDSLFTTSSEVLGEEASADITGLIGQYAHGNEPSHHIAYLFNSVEEPWRTQEVVSEILDKFYTDQPDGLCGNEDCGQMSAWYLLSSMGFYPICPGDDTYSIGRPSFDKVEIAMAKGKVFTVIAENRGEGSPYVQEVKLNGVKLTEPFINHADIEAGSTLTFVMGSEKNIFWE
ncbi:MAG: GH92 family glycosyl hydrolase [Bacteroides sp.]|nr:GH92 family glycosyl hydrolase [Bacteroides sp.]